MRIPPCAPPRRHALRPARRSVPAVATLTAAALVAGTLGAATLAAPAAGAATVTPAASAKSVTITWRGNGHGHGMSQYGARGAAAAGLSFRRIIAFYYPHTTLVRQSSRTIRVLLGGFGSTTTAVAWPGLTVTGVSGALPSTSNGVSRYRLVADGHRGLTLQQLRAAKGAHWTTYRAGLPNRAGFTRGNGHRVRIMAPDGSSNYYWGVVRAVRTTASGTGAVNSVETVDLERYVAGVAPREMPASWARAAVDAQAIAARTYAQYEMDHPRNRDWDICDTTACQFYGGAAYLDASGNRVWSEDMSGVTDTSNLVAEYHGSAIFAQFSASNGGWTVDGGQPYLVARADPYDNAASGDPYLAMTHKTSLSSLARSYGLSKVSRIVTTTDGHGAWGGRTSTVTIYGTRSGKATHVTTTGFGLANTLGAWTDWFRLATS